MIESRRVVPLVEFALKMLGLALLALAAFLIGPTVGVAAAGVACLAAAYLP